MKGGEIMKKWEKPVIKKLDVRNTYAGGMKQETDGTWMNIPTLGEVALGSTTS